MMGRPPQNSFPKVMTGTLPELQQPPQAPPSQPVTIHPARRIALHEHDAVKLTLLTNLLWGL